MEKLIDGTPEERAQKLEEVLRCTLKANKLELARGAYQVVEDGSGEVCQACALGTLACSMGLELERNSWSGRSNRKRIFDGVAERGKYLTVDEAIQLELGFERVKGKAAEFMTYGGVKADQLSPFWQLGARLSKEASPIRREDHGYTAC